MAVVATTDSLALQANSSSSVQPGTLMASRKKCWSSNNPLDLNSQGAINIVIDLTILPGRLPLAPSASPSAYSPVEAVTTGIDEAATSVIKPFYSLIIYSPPPNISYFAEEAYPYLVEDSAILSQENLNPNVLNINPKEALNELPKLPLLMHDPYSMSPHIHIKNQTSPPGASSKRIPCSCADWFPNDGALPQRIW